MNERFEKFNNKVVKVLYYSESNITEIVGLFQYYSGYIDMLTLTTLINGKKHTMQLIEIFIADINSVKPEDEVIFKLQL